jgi:hypothetical protein
VAATASNYNWADIGQARQVIGAEAGKFGSVGDEIPASVDAGMFGTLPESGAAAQAVSALCAALRTEYAAAETLVGEIERTLDNTEQSTTNNDQDSQQTFQAQQA